MQRFLLVCLILLAGCSRLGAVETPSDDPQGAGIPSASTNQSGAPISHTKLSGYPTLDAVSDQELSSNTYSQNSLVIKPADPTTSGTLIGHLMSLGYQVLRTSVSGLITVGLPGSGPQALRKHFAIIDQLDGVEFVSLDAGSQTQ